MREDPDRTKVAIRDPLDGTVIADRYRIEMRIAAGGFGAIYRALDLVTDTDVALKLLHPRLTSDRAVVARFRREGAALAQLRDPHTVTAYDMGETRDGALYIAMELLEGESLHEHFRRLGPLPWRRVAAIARSVCSSLAEAHALGIIHRDLKPANIHLEQRGDDHDYVKVLDFGIAKIVHGGPLDDRGTPVGSAAEGRRGSIDSSELTSVGQMIGTFDYMPLEQMVGGECTAQSDLFTLGIVMYELLTGKRPFGDAQTATAMLTLLLTATPELPSRRADAPAELDRIIMRCLDRTPALRFHDAIELGAALDLLIASDGATRTEVAVTVPRTGTLDSLGDDQTWLDEMPKPRAPASSTLPGVIAPKKPPPR